MLRSGRTAGRRVRRQASARVRTGRLSGLDARVLVLGLALTVAPAGVGCDGDSGPTIEEPREVASVQVSPAETELPVGATTQFHAVALDAAGNPLTDRTVEWSSSSSAIAAVSSTGLVTANAPGTATITATVDDKSGQAEVVVSADGAPPSGLQPALITYLGGSGVEVIRDIAIDAQGNAYLTGGTTSSDFPTTPGAFDTSFNNPGSNDHDVFVMKVSTSGQVLWSTLIGGPNYDRAYAVEVDAQGFVYVAGRAGPGFPVTSGALQSTFGGGDPGHLYGEQDGFLCKLRPNGDAVVFCTYFGNEDDVPIRDIALDPAGNVYIIASAAVGSLPAAWFQNAYQRTRRGDRDILVAKVASDGSRVEWATYVGGSAGESNTNSIRLDPGGNVLFLASTRSADMPVPNGFDTSLGGPPDLYLGKLSPDGSQLIYGTYVGGSQPDFTETHELEVDAQGNAIVAAMTRSPDFPTTTGSFQPDFAGVGGPGAGAGTNYPGDAFIAKVSPDGGRLLAATFIGGRAGEGIEGVAVDADGNIYVSGTTYSNDFPTTEASRGAASGANLFAAKFSPDLGTLLYSAVFGGSDHDEIRASAADRSGVFFIGGASLSPNLPTLVPMQAVLHGEADAVLVKLVPR